MEKQRQNYMCNDLRMRNGCGSGVAQINAVNNN